MWPVRCSWLDQAPKSGGLPRCKVNLSLTPNPRHVRRSRNLWPLLSRFPLGSGSPFTRIHLFRTDAPYEWWLPTHALVGVPTVGTASIVRVLSKAKQYYRNRRSEIGPGLLSCSPSVFPRVCAGHERAALSGREGVVFC